jgi:uncharacterized protein (DUF885 family)
VRHPIDRGVLFHVLPVLLVLAIQGIVPAEATSPRRIDVAGPGAAPTPRLRALEDEFIGLVVRLDPVRASQLGLHEGDAALGPAGFAGRERARLDWREFEDRLLTLSDTLTDRDDRFDIALMLYDIRMRRFEQDSLRVWSRDPGRALRSVAGGIQSVLGREHAPLAVRARSLVGRLRETPAYLEAALPMISDPPRVLTEQAMAQADALVATLIDGIPAATASIEDSALVADLTEATAAALQGVLAYREALSGDVLPRAGDDFALGPELFAGYLRAAEGIEIPLPRLRARAEEELRRYDARFTATAARIDSIRSPRDVMLSVSADHPEPGGVLVAAAEAIREALAFTLRDESVQLPPGPPIQVRATPPQSRWTNASLVAPGPFESSGFPAIFYVTLPDPASSPGEQLELIRFFNRSILLNVALHETYPGHYLHALTQAALARPARRAIWSRGFGEGWAHYVEGLAVDRGFHRDDDAFRLATQQSALRRLGRFRVALGLHTEGWTIDAAARYLETHCYLEPSMARREAARGAFDPLYLVYALGRSEIESMRAEVMRAEGADFDLARFHARLLALGAPPVPLARAYLLHEPLAPARWLD